jgi:hypothetical protein
MSVPKPSFPAQAPGSSLSDLLTAVKNLVVALNAATQAFKNVNGVSTKEGITAPTVVKTSAGRVASVSILVAGTTPGTVYDSASLTPNAPLILIPNLLGLYEINMPTDSGILVVPGADQVLTVNWS